MKSALNEFAFTFLLLPIYANSFYWLHAPSWFIMTRHSSNSFVQILAYLTLEVGMKLCNNEDKMRLLLWWRIKFFYTMYECRMVQSKMMIWRIFGLVKLILEFITTGTYICTRCRKNIYLCIKIVQFCVVFDRSQVGK